jgi:hypothetical protein
MPAIWIVSWQKQRIEIAFAQSWELAVVAGPFVQRIAADQTIWMLILIVRVLRVPTQEPQKLTLRTVSK